MKIIFKAEKVDYSEALDGDLIQVTFEQRDSEDYINDPPIYVSISVLYEFPPYEPSIEWYDGSEFNGGIEIESYELKNGYFEINLENGDSFEIDFEVDKTTFKNIESFLSDIL
jgi:hypothetical protein